ncbi:MAG TPA: SigE family RNA polymerase sigma factor [Frankiaceae bacterium]|jgi:RNA polymerase sigma-70 factor (sigma-E family)|nr:SigE family RNA polymerase sigma factor [Frankiaceae bacterium]
MDGAEGFDEFAATRWPGLVRAAWLLTADWQRAEDVAQVALTKAWRHWRRVCTADDPDRYVRRIVVNEFLRARRRWREEAPLTGDGVVPSGDDGVAERDALVRALRRLPPGQRLAVVLRHYLDLSEADAAAAMGCAEGTVKSQASRGLARLRDEYGVERTEA